LRTFADVLLRLRASCREVEEEEEEEEKEEEEELHLRSKNGG